VLRKINIRTYFQLLLLLQALILAAMSPLWASPSLAERLVSLDNDTRAAAQQEASTLPVNDQKRLAATLEHILGGNDPDQSEHAAEALGQLGPAAYSAMPALREGLGNDFPYVRNRCSEALFKMGPASVPELIKALKSENLDVRSLASAVLEKLGPASKPAIPALVASLDDPASIIQAAAGRALTRIGGDAVPALEEALGNPHFHNRIGAVQTLSNIDQTPPDLADHLVAFLGEGDTQLRMVVIKALAHKGDTSIPALRKVLSSENPLTSSGAAEVISDIGPKAAPAVPELTAALKNPDSRVRRSAARALGNIGFGAGSAVPALEIAAKDPDKDVAVRAAEALTSITVFTKEGKRVTMDNAQVLAREAAQSNNQQAVATLKPSKAGAGSRSSGVGSSRSPAAGTGTKLPPKTEAAPSRGPISEIQWLKRCASNDSNARLAAAQAFARMGATAIQASERALDDDDWRLRQCACKTLEQFGSLASPAFDGLDQALHDSSAEVRQSAVQALRAINSITAISSVEAATSDSDVTVRLAALSALESLGPGSDLQISPLEARLQDSHEEVQAASIRVLENIGTPEAKKAIESYRKTQTVMRVNTLVLEICQSSQPTDTANIAALVQIGSPAVLPVSKLLADPKTRIRLTAAKILNQLGAAAAPATQPLIEALTDPDESVRSESSQALEKIGSPQAKNPLRLYYAKEKARLYLKKMHLGGS
jgi:HEAT repeat protein